MKNTLALAVLLAAAPAAAQRPAASWDVQMLNGPLGVCVHLPGGYTEVQQGALAALGLTKVRTDVFYDNPASPELLKFRDGGYDVLGIILPEHKEARRALYRKFEEDPEAFLAHYVEALPWINHWEFSNETDNEAFGRLSPAEYVGHLKRAYEVFRRKYPEKTLVSASPMGNGNGADYLKKMIQAGLLTMPELVIGVHVYDGKTKDFKVAGRRVWVTETGRTWNKQVEHWTKKVREVQSVIQPERIYWYANWEDKQPGDGDGWISIEKPSMRVIPSPLYQRLAAARAGIAAP